MRMSSKRPSPPQDQRERTDGDALTSQASAIADLQVGIENITASGAHRIGSEMSAAMAAFTEEQLRVRADAAVIAATVTDSEAILERMR